MTLTPVACTHRVTYLGITYEYNTRERRIIQLANFSEKGGVLVDKIDKPTSTSITQIAKRTHRLSQLTYFIIFLEKVYQVPGIYF